MKFKGCRVQPHNNSLLPVWKSHEISCCHGHGGHPQGAGSAQTAGTPLKPSPLDAHPGTGGAEVPVLPWRDRGHRRCPADKDQCLGKQSSEKSLLSTFPCKNNRTGSDPGCPCRAVTKQSSHLPPAAPCPLPCQHGTPKSQLRGPVASAAIGVQHLVHTGTVPRLVLWLEAEQEGLAPLNEPLQGFLFCLQQEQRCFLHPGSCFPSYWAGHTRIKQSN